MASKRRQRRKACEGKVRHGSFDAGMTALHSLLRARGPQAPMTVYRCGFCGGYHVGHAPGRVRQSIRDKRRFRCEAGRERT